MIIEYQLYVNSSAPDKNCCWLNRFNVCPRGVSDMSDIDLTSIQLTKKLTTGTVMLPCVESYSNSNILFWWKRALTNLHCRPLLNILKRSPHNTSEVDKWKCLVSCLFEEESTYTSIVYVPIQVRTISIRTLLTIVMYDMLLHVPGKILYVRNMMWYAILRTTTIPFCLLSPWML